MGTTKKVKTKKGKGCDGKSIMWLGCDKGGRLLLERVDLKKERVPEVEVDYCSFMVSTNLHRTKAGGKHCLVVFLCEAGDKVFPCPSGVGQERGGSDGYSIGICLDCDENGAAIMELIGSARDLVRVLEEEGDTLVELELRGVFVRTYKPFGSSDPSTKMWFVNLVGVPRVLSAAITKPDVVNASDGCYQMSVSGPDMCHGRKVPCTLKQWATGMVNRYIPPKWDMPSLSNARWHDRGDFLLVRSSPSNLQHGLGAIGTFQVPRLFSDEEAGRTGTAFFNLKESAISELIKLLKEKHHGIEEFNRTAARLSDDYQEGYVCIDARPGCRANQSREDERPLHIAYVPERVDFNKCKFPGATSSLPESPGAKWLDNSQETHLLLTNEKFEDILQAGTSALAISHLGTVPQYQQVCAFSSRYCGLFSHVYGDKGSYPSRRKCRMIGHNTYLGPTDSLRPKNKPNKGPGVAHLSQYYRETFRNPYVATSLHKYANRLSCLAAIAAEQLCRPHFELHNESFEMKTETERRFNSLCTAEIFTMGSPDRLFFATSKHLDNDSFGEHIQATLKENLEDEEFPMREQDKAYLKSWVEELGAFDAYTTCAYGAVGEPPAGAEIYTYFNLNGVATSIRLGIGVMHAFHGGQVNNNTAASVAVVNGRVLMSLDDHYIVGWGLGKPTRSTVPRRRYRRRELAGLPPKTSSRKRSRR
jgi:hypothetical protein